MIPNSSESNQFRRIGGNTRIPIKEPSSHAIDPDQLAVCSLAPEIISQQKLETRRKTLIEGAMRAYFQKHESVSQEGKTEINYLLLGTIIGFVDFYNALEMFNMSPVVQDLVDSEENITHLFEYLSRTFINNRGSMRSDLRGHQGPEKMEIINLPTYQKLVDSTLSILKLGEKENTSDSEKYDDTQDLVGIDRLDNERTTIDIQLAKRRAERFVYEVMASIML